MELSNLAENKLRKMYRKAFGLWRERPWSEILFEMGSGKLLPKTPETKPMIPLEDLKKLQDLLDSLLKFKIGDIVQPAALGDYVAEPCGIGREQKGDAEPTYNLSFHDTIRYQVVERWIQQCYGGIQKHYHLRLVNRDGIVDRQLISLTEDELTLSRPFEHRRFMTADEIRAYPDGGYPARKRA